MTQWGKKKKVCGASFYPLVNVRGWSPISDDCIMCDIYLLSDGGNLQKASIILDNLKKKYIGSPYKLW